MGRGALPERFGKRVTGRGGGRRAVLALVALASACIATAALAGEAGLIIETGSPDALCPELASTRAAVSRRLGELIVPGGSSGFRARYTIAHAPVGSPRDFVRLELYGPEGTLQLTRDLPLEGESCSTMAEVIALVLDRYFRALLAHDRLRSGDDELPLAAPAARAAAGPPPPAPEPDAPLAAPVPEPSRAALPSGALPSDAGPEQQASNPTSPPGGSDRLALAALEVAFRSPDMPALGVRAMLEALPRLYLGTALHIGLRSETEVLSGDAGASSREMSWRLDVGWGPRLGPVRTYVGPVVCLGIARGWGDGLPQQSSGYRATWAVGIDAGGQWVTDAGWSFGAAAALDVAVYTGQFIIDGQEVLEPERLRGWLGMSVGHAF